MISDLDLASVRFPSAGHIWIPRRGRRAAAAGLSMHSPCAPAKVMAQRALYAGVRLLGSRLIPGERATWSPDMPHDEWAALLETWSRAAGDFDSIAIYSRPQAGRTGFAVLLLDRGRGVAFARVHPEPERVAREHAVLTSVYSARPVSFRVARPIGVGQSSAYAWMLTESVPNYPLGAVRSERTREEVARELSQILLAAIERPEGTPAHWLPAHGDFSPWNLRTDLSRSVRVIDWEDAGFAPPGTDVLYGALTAHATFGSLLPATASAEAAGWIQEILLARIKQETGSGGPNSALLEALSSLSLEDR